ncbi:MAG: substrate-binding domain-containing protein [Eubacteriales bacterium]|nr:substrate-binding domain-containing protein [Eubacteriales bacterium]
MKDRQIPVLFDEKSTNTTQYANTIQGIRNAATRYGSKLQLISDAEVDSLDFHSLPPVAIITSASMPFVVSCIHNLRSAGRRAVLAGLDSEQFGHDVSCATPSRRTETQQLVNYLYNCGKQNLALVGFGQNSINDNFRYHAAMSAVAAWGRILSEHDVWLWQRDPHASFEAFLDGADRYDAVICPNDVLAICFINCCREHGVRVPEDLYVASFGNMTIGRYFRPSITSMTMDMLNVGEQAFNVWRFLSNNDMQNNALKITVPGRILARESTENRCIEPDSVNVMPSLQADRFYSNPTIAVLVGIENCISQRDKTDLRIIRGMLDKLSYEVIADELFISGSTLRYRLTKIFSDAGVKTRQEFEELVRRNLGEGNPFQYID